MHNKAPVKNSVKIARMQQILISTSQSVVRLDTANPWQATLSASGAGLYYGLAPTPQGTVWMAARHSQVSDNIDSADETGRLYQLSKGGLAETPPPELPLRDLHGLAMHRDSVWLTCSHDDGVAIYKPATRTWCWWYPLGPPDPQKPDQYHFNTLHFEGELVWVVAHCRGPSWLLAFPIAAALRGETPPPTHRIQLGQQAHNLWRHSDGTLCTCSSIEGRLVSQSGWELNTGDFPRGVARLPDGWVVGVSALKERRERDLSDAKLQFYGHDWQLQREVVLPRVGMVLDIVAIPWGLQLPNVGELRLAAG
jgi:hypothetical protein